LALVDDDTRVLLLIDVVTRSAGTRAAGKQAHGHLEIEVKPAVTAFPKRDTAREGNRIATLVYNASRLMAGI
jgi:hypothetical protein